MDDELVVLFTSVDCHEIQKREGHVRSFWEYVAFFAKPFEDGILLTYISSRRPAKVLLNYDTWHYRQGRVLLPLKGFLESIKPASPHRQLFKHFSSTMPPPRHEENKTIRSFTDST